MLLLLALSTAVSLSGYVPPHRANDGRVFLATGSAPVVTAALSTCGIRSFSDLGHGVQFALTVDDAGRARCVADRLGETGAVAVQDHWVGPDPIAGR